jgi:hypothetical protein
MSVIPPETLSRIFEAIDFASEPSEPMIRDGVGSAPCHVCGQLVFFRVVEGEPLFGADGQTLYSRLPVKQPVPHDYVDGSPCPGGKDPT